MGPPPFAQLYHLFAQFHTGLNASFGNPNAGTEWYHAVSKDLLRWTHLPIALRPTEPYE